jgi:hypothetical protein
MKYCQIYRTAEPKIVGVKTGASQVELRLNNILQNQEYINFNNHFSGYNKNFFQDQTKIKNLNPPLFNGVLRKNAKVTDLMEYGPKFTNLNNLYSQKYINIIKSFNIDNYKIFEFEIENVKEKYYLMYIKTIATTEVIFDKSLLYTGHKILNNLKYFSVTNYEDFLQLVEKEPLIRYEKVAISKEYYDRDIISVQATGGHFYSERLIDFLLDCGITGLQVSYNNSIELEFV